MPVVSPTTPLAQTANMKPEPANAVEPNLSVWAHPNLALLYGGTRGAARSSDGPADDSTPAGGLS